MSDTPSVRHVLITGCSTGIGAACAADLDAQGFHVFAGVRKLGDADELAQRSSDRLVPVILDVTSAEQIAQALQQITERTDGMGLAGVVNNAGILVPGPVEMLDTDDLRRQFEVNTFGSHAVTNACLPLLRQAAGRIVMMSSVSGRVVPPYLGAYAASKHAMEALSDAYRNELRPWGIAVALIEPDGVATPIWDKLQDAAAEKTHAADPAVTNLYAKDIARMRQATEEMGRGGMPVDRVVQAVRHALTARRPKIRYPVGSRVRWAEFGRRVLRDSHLDWFMRRAMGLK